CQAMCPTRECDLPRLELGPDQAKTLSRGGLKALFFGRIESRRCQYRVSANDSCLLDSSIGGDRNLNLDRAGDVHLPGEIRVKRLDLTLGPTDDLISALCVLCFQLG